MGIALEDAMDYMDGLMEEGYSEAEAMFAVESAHKPDSLIMSPHQLNEGIKMRVKHYHESRQEALMFILRLNAENISHFCADEYNPYKKALMKLEGGSDSRRINAERLGKDNTGSFTLVKKKGG